MAASTPSKTRSTGKLERQLGFREARIFARRPKDAVYECLFNEVDPIIEEASDLEASNTWTPDSAKPRINRAFDILGPLLWPSRDPERAYSNSWLVDATANDWDGLYPRNLYFEVKEHQDV